MHDFDLDSSGRLDIEEFIAMMNIGEGATGKLQSKHSTNAFFKIQKANKLNVMDFFSAVSNLPQSFIASSFGKNWDQRRNLPSTTFRPQIDPRTMMWKDMPPVETQKLSKEM